MQVLLIQGPPRVGKSTIISNIELWHTQGFTNVRGLDLEAHLDGTVAWPDFNCEDTLNKQLTEIGDAIEKLVSGIRPVFFKHNWGPSVVVATAAWPAETLIRLLLNRFHDSEDCRFLTPGTRCKEFGLDVITLLPPRNVYDRRSRGRHRLRCSLRGFASPTVTRT